MINFLFKYVLRINVDCSWSVHFTSKVVAPEKIKFGNDVENSFILSGGCYIQGGNGIEIGDNTIFGPGVKIISANHDPDKSFKWALGKPLLKIGKNCWIGVNAVILPEVVIGNNVIVGAGSVVTKSFGDNVMIAGNPAKIVRSFKK